MPGLHRAVLARATAAALVLGLAYGGHAVVGPALARRGVERAERDAYVCGQAARLAAATRADRSQTGGRPGLTAVIPVDRCPLGRP